MKFEIEIGTIINNWKIIEKSNKEYHYKCECQCIEKIVKIKNIYQIISGNSRSCGCLRSEILKESKKIHGDCHTRFYNIWRSIKQRTTDPNYYYKQNYIERGIKISDRWLEYDNFKEDMYESYIEHINKFGENNTSIERKDNNKNYDIENCKWATRKEQQNNRRNMNFFEATYTIPGPSFNYKEKGKNVINFSSKYNLPYNSVLKCLKGKQKLCKGWTFEWINNV